MFKPESPIKWLRRRAKEGAVAHLGMLTGQDTRALEAIAASWDLYASGDAHAERAALEAVRHLLLALQPQCRHFARELIARSMDWDDRARLWRLVAPDDVSIEACAETR